HLQRRLHGPGGAAGLGVGHHLAELRRHDLPRDAESILAPAARTFLAALGGEATPQVVNLLLRVADHGHRDTFAEIEGRPTVEGSVLATIELEDRADQLALGDQVRAVA